jgi:hypothetical protein
LNRYQIHIECKLLLKKHQRQIDNCYCAIDPAAKAGPWPSLRVRLGPRPQNRRAGRQNGPHTSPSWAESSPSAHATNRQAAKLARGQHPHGPKPTCQRSVDHSRPLPLMPIRRSAAGFAAIETPGATASLTLASFLFSSPGRLAHRRRRTVWSVVGSPLATTRSATRLACRHGPAPSLCLLFPFPLYL